MSTRSTVAAGYIGPIVSLAAAALGGSVGCAGASHIKSYEPKHRDYKSPVDLSARPDDTSNGSLFSSAHSLFADQRAIRAGDILTINVVEDANAERGAVTDLTRDSNSSLDISSLFGVLKLLDGKLDKKLLEGAQKSDFYGKGSTSRTDHVRATVPAIVQQVLPNGNLFIEGHRVILVNDEEHHFYVSGVIRPADIVDNNSVDSTRIADAEIEFTGTGAITEKQHPGWLQRALDAVAPF